MKITGIDKEQKVDGLYKQGNVILDQCGNVYLVVGIYDQEKKKKKFALVNLSNSMIARHSHHDISFDSESELEDAYSDYGDDILSGSFEFKPDSEE